MKKFLETLFSSDFEPHGYCYLWNPGLVALRALPRRGDAQPDGPEDAA